MFVSFWSAVYTRCFESRKKGRKKYVTTRVVSTWDILTRRDRFFSVEQIWQQREKRGRKSDTSWNNNCILKKVWPIWFCKKVWFSFHVNGKLHKNWSLNYRGILVGLVEWILYWPALIWRFFMEKKNSAGWLLMRICIFSANYNILFISWFVSRRQPAEFFLSNKIVNW